MHPQAKAGGEDAQFDACVEVAFLLRYRRFHAEVLVWCGERFKLGNELVVIVAHSVTRAFCHAVIGQWPWRT